MTAIAAVTQLPTMSLSALGAMGVSLLASVWTFHRLTQRWTSERARTLLAEWAAERKFELRWHPRTTLPSVLRRLGATAPVEASLGRGELTLLRVRTHHAWHVLLKQTGAIWTPAALRPLHAAESLADAFELPAFPAVLSSDRFLVCAAESRAARALAQAPARGLLPPDVGLLLHGSYVMLDFSARPFDTVEFDRMLVVMEQLNDHLPVPRGTGL